MASCKQREFEAHALAHVDALYRVARRMSQSAAEAEDLVQEVFYRAYRSFSRFRKGSNCKAWLFKILLNVRLSRAAAVRQGRTKVIPLAAFSQRRDDAADPERLVSARIELERVRKALDSLPEEYRAALLLCDVEGLSYKHAARVMGCPVGTVRSRLARGRALLRQRLEASASQNVGEVDAR